ncbi:hypothetical protein KAFR_0D02270 [Kazachstania africana CBS 2517]|uniref:Kinetochore protein NDC80 n=1 Tax=Kazachstania africana (strain ATCC 22294 / BCRC 22015 / CBS 2517 / CECT 1963 / NBRC 1671 / NRRL Y-8276) TaxID=1071382 RepID=H2AU24_KAZAF|nr:hypothetical protein KAFR_0D02270 [Kazachstania africana CBS 2517]CCF57874.1 hypothetical protein KAFR_0D02270 [Kazachstania africana CBS 2517]
MDLDPHRFVSQIPVLSSQNVNQESNKHRRNSASAELSEMMNKSIAANTKSDHIKRKRSRSTVVNNNELQGLPNRSRALTLSEVGATKRNSSYRLSQRHSLQNRSSFYGNELLQSQSHATNRDPRPLRDKNFQSAIQQEIFDYLLQNKFDIETNHPISLKSLKQPTQKGFIIIFKWLYSRLDPGYQFTKSIEYEIYQILKNLQYPYLETINKSQISAVGGSSWHKFLGLLHWLIRVNIKLDKLSSDFNQSLLNQPTQEMVVINSSKTISTLDEQDQIQEKYEIMVENLFIDYISRSYQNFLNSNDDFNTAMEELTTGFEKFTHIIDSDINTLAVMNDRMFENYQFIIKRHEKFKVSIEKYNALKGDLTKFQNYISTMESKSVEWPKKIDKMNSELEKKKSETNDIENDIRNILKSLDDRGLSIEQIEEQNKEKEALMHEVDEITDQTDKLTGNIRAKKVENNNIVKNLINVLKQYNMTLEKLFNEREKMDGIDSTSQNKTKFKIQLPDSISTNDTTESVPVLYDDLFKDIIPSIPAESEFSITELIRKEASKLKLEIFQKIEIIKSENSGIEEEILKLKNEINQKNTENEKLEDELLELKSLFDITRQKNENLLVSERITIEKLEKKNNDSSKTITSKTVEANQLVKKKRLQLEELQRTLNAKRVSLHKEIFEIINFVATFKSSMQNAVQMTQEELTKEFEKVNQLDDDI